MIVRVAPENLTALWPQLEPLVVAALRGTPTHDAGDIRRSILGMETHLFISYKEEVVSFVLTKFCCYPQGVWMHIWLAASLETEPFDLMAFYDALEAWRKYHGCRGLQITGARTGWLKRIPFATLEGVTLRTTDE